MTDKVTEHPPKRPALFANFDSGVLWFGGEPVFYTLKPDRHWEARVIGSPDLLPITPGLIDAINSDIAHQQSKQ